MIGAKVEIVGMKPFKLTQKIKLKSEELKSAMAGVADMTAQSMRNIIKSNIKRPPTSGYLVRSIDMEIIGDGSVIGVGNLAKMPKYWKVINYGGAPWKGKGFYGIFHDGAPQPGGKGNRWFEGGTDDNGRMSFMRPKKPIVGINFVSKTKNWIAGYWRGYISAVFKK